MRPELWYSTSVTRNQPFYSRCQRTDNCITQDMTQRQNACISDIILQESVPSIFKFYIPVKSTFTPCAGAKQDFRITYFIFLFFFFIHRIYDFAVKMKEMSCAARNPDFGILWPVNLQIQESSLFIFISLFFFLSFFLVYSLSLGSMKSLCRP